MGRGEAVIVAGIGCRRGCAAADIVAAVRLAGGADALAAPAWKREEAGLLDAAAALGLPLHFVDDDALAAVQDLCVTRSDAVARRVGYASVAEAAALAFGGALVQPRLSVGGATCALSSESASSAIGLGGDCGAPRK